MALQIAIIYAVAYLVYTIGTLITAPAALIGLAVVVAIGIMIANLLNKTNQTMTSEYALKK